MLVESPYHLGPISLMIFPLNFTIQWKLPLLSSKFYQRDHYKNIWMTCQLCCRGTCKFILIWWPGMEWQYNEISIKSELWWEIHYSDVIMSMMVSQIAGVSIVYSNICSGVDQRKHQSSVSLAFVRGIHRWPENSPHKGPVKRKMFPFDDVIMFLKEMGPRAIIQLWYDQNILPVILGWFCWLFFS